MDEFQINVLVAKELLDAGKAILIDVREQSEYRLSKIECSILIPLAEINNNIEGIKEKAGNKLVIVHCHHGFRSSFACQILQKNGINARNMVGGIDDWSKKIDSNVARY